MTTVLAFIRRDFLVWSSYRLSVLWSILGVVVLSGIVYFLGSALGDNAAFIAEQSGSYVAFLLAGIAFTDVFYQGLVAPPQAIREHQSAGTLEPMLVTPINMAQLALLASVFKVLLSITRLAVFLAFGVLVLGFWEDANPLSALLIFIPAWLSFLGLGTLSAAFIILVKQGDPILVAYGAISSLLGGTLFPIEVLPDWIRPFSNWIPLTPGLAGIRAALNGASPAEIAIHLQALIIMAAVLLPVGLAAFHRAVVRSKKVGTLDQY